MYIQSQERTPISQHYERQILHKIPSLVLMHVLDLKPVPLRKHSKGSVVSPVLCYSAVPEKFIHKCKQKQRDFRTKVVGSGPQNFQYTNILSRCPPPPPPLLNKSVIPQEILAEEGENLQIMSLSAAHKGDVDSILLSIFTTYIVTWHT